MGSSDSNTPRIMFRTMRADSDDYPLCDDTARSLGVRARDVGGIESGTIDPGCGGMSIMLDHPKHLQPHRRPPSLDGGVAKDPTFSISSDELPRELTWRIPDKKNQFHALIEPSGPMELDDYKRALCQTRKKWRRWHG